MAASETYWVLAADQRRARIFASDASLEMSREIVNISVGAGVQGAKEVAEVLALAYAAGRFDWLVLLAPRDFLERLRAHLEPQVFLRVLVWISREATPLPRDWRPALVLQPLRKSG